MKDNFAACLQQVLKHEGGWADHPSDPGGATMKGVTIGTFAQFKGRKVTKDELRAISDADLLAIYRRKYWDLVRGDDLPRGLDLVAFDGAVNSGPSRGAKWVQKALRVPDDGKIGPATIAAAQAYHTGDAITDATAYRIAFLRGLRTWGTFGKGWSRRVHEVRDAAMAMASKPVAASPTPVPAIKPPHVEHQAPVPVAEPGLFALIAKIIAAIFGGRK